MTEYFKPERDDRASLKAMLIALDASDTTLKRDVIRGEGRTGDWGIRGSTVATTMTAMSSTQTVRAICFT